ncbi:hypothetical protein ABPG74_004570 [Tetrahymena malaccensis]
MMNHQYQYQQQFYDERDMYLEDTAETVKQMIQNPPKYNQKISIEDFNLVKVIGKGSYAKVVLVKKKEDGRVYAIKILKKSYIEQKKQVEHIKTERNILVDADHPFIIKLHYSFQNERKLFFVLDYCQGGELFNLLCKYKRFNEQDTKFYCAQIVLALEYLHEKDIIYRDLKPENVLIDRQGYLKITDFGLSKRNSKDQKNQSICGTPEYLAPEVLAKVGHGKPVDWWTLGCLMYELLTGFPPFYTEDRKSLFEQIKNCPYPNLPKEIVISRECQDIISRLLQKDPNQRLGVHGAQEVKQHPFFRDINWQGIIRKEVKAPLVPKVKNEEDTSNIDPEFTQMDMSSLKNGGNSIEPSNNINYHGFSYQKPL